MNPPLIAIAALIKAAREEKGLSQRELGERVGLPQSHISKIENAAVDLQTTNLIEIARVLDLEFTLVPRALLPAVQALQRQSTSMRSQSAAVREPRSTTARDTSKAVPAYRLDDVEDSDV